MMQPKTQSRGFLFLLAFAAVVAAACDDGPGSPVGNYVLSTIDNKSVPVTMFSDTSYLVEIRSGKLAVKADGAFETVTELRETVQSHASTFWDTVDGTWAQSGSTLTLLTAVDSTKMSATWRKSSLTLVVGDSTGRSSLVYVR